MSATAPTTREVAMPTVSTQAVQPAAGAAVSRERAAMVYAIGGDLRFLSHHDELRMLSRALVRARWPVAFSRGFNPRPRFSLALPRPVGTASECEWAVAELCELRPAEELAAALAGVLPGDCRLLAVHAPSPDCTLLPRRIGYEVDLTDYVTVGAEHGGSVVAERIALLLNRSQIEVERRHGPDKPAQRVDIRPYIETVKLDGNVLRMHLLFAQQRSARPLEILGEIGLPAVEYAHRVRRVWIEWKNEPTGAPDAPAALEGTGLGQGKETARA